VWRKQLVVIDLGNGINFSAIRPERANLAILQSCLEGSVLTQCRLLKGDGLFASGVIKQFLSCLQP
jgi:hypothetical protein